MDSCGLKTCFRWGVLRAKSGGPLKRVWTLCCDLCKNGCTNQDAVWDPELGRSEDPCIRWESHWRYLANTIVAALRSYVTLLRPLVEISAVIKMLSPQLLNTVNCVGFCFWLSVTLFVYEMSRRTAERICTKFTGKMCLVAHSEEFEYQGQLG